MKNLKGLAILIALAVFCSVMLFSCGDDGEINIDLQDLADVILEKIDLPDYDTYTADKIQNEFGITADDTIQILVLKKIDMSNISNAEMIFLAEAKDPETAIEIETKLKTYKTYKIAEVANYAKNPDNERQWYIIDASEILVRQQYVFLVMHGQHEEIKINDTIKDYIKNNNKAK